MIKRRGDFGTRRQREKREHLREIQQTNNYINYGNAYLVDASIGRVVKIFTDHRDQLFDAAFSPDGSKVLTASMDKTANLWDVSTVAHFIVDAAETDKYNNQSVELSR